MLILKLDLPLDEQLERFRLHQRVWLIVLLLKDYVLLPQQLLFVKLSVLAILHHSKKKFGGMIKLSALTFFRFIAFSNAYGFFF